MAAKRLLFAEPLVVEYFYGIVPGVLLWRVAVRRAPACGLQLINVRCGCCLQDMKASWAASPGTTGAAQPTALLTLQAVQGQPPPPPANIVANSVVAATAQTPKPDTSSK